jgi:hypothetical protein
MMFLHTKFYINYSNCSLVIAMSSKREETLAYLPYCYFIFYKVLTRQNLLLFQHARIFPYINVRAVTFVTVKMLPAHKYRPEPCCYY